MGKRIKIYVGCAIMYASEEFKQSVYDLKDSLRQDYEILDFKGEGAEPREAYLNDIKECVAKCDLLLAICDHPSLGLGYEIASAIEAFGKPVLAVAHKDAQVSLLIQGIDSPLFSLERYDDLSEIKSLIGSKVNQ